MARWSNNLTACINLCTLIVGICILAVGMTVTHNTPTSSCHTLLVYPSVRIGSIIIVVSLFGLLGSCCRSPFLMWLYLVFYFIIVVVMGVGVVLWLGIVMRGQAKSDNGEEYRHTQFASWFKDAVFGMADWPDIRRCITDSDLCLMDSRSKTHLYSIPKLQSACCTLPPWCIYDPNNATIPDCHTWSTDKNKMCYYCDACIGGFLSQVNELWRRLFPGYVALFILAVVVFILGCRNFQQHKCDHYKKVCYATKA